MLVSSEEQGGRMVSTVTQNHTQYHGTVPVLVVVLYVTVDAIHPPNSSQLPVWFLARAAGWLIAWLCAGRVLAVC